MKLAILFVVGVIARQTYADEPEAIIGGNNAVVGQFKHQVSLQHQGEHICGGSLIDEYHVLTAAHCVTNTIVQNLFTRVLAGTTYLKGGRIKHKIKCIRIHPNYTGKMSDGWNDDIAVITLRTPVTANQHQGPIRLPSKDCATGENRGIISGWGMANSAASSLLRWVEVKVLSQERCLSEHKKRESDDPYTTEKQVCASVEDGKGACQGDRGGPLMVNGELCGIVSWVSPCVRDVSNVFINVFHYLDFIKESIEMC